MLERLGMHGFERAGQDRTWPDQRLPQRAACIQKCLEDEIDQDMAFAISDMELSLRLGICIGSPLRRRARRLNYSMGRPGFSRQFRVYRPSSRRFSGM